MVLKLDPWSGRALPTPGISNIPNVLKGQNVLIPTGYGTAATNQTENFKYLQTGSANYEEVYTVPAGKTFYVSSIVWHNPTAGSGFIATGASGSEVNIMGIYSSATLMNQLNFNIPLKFVAGTRISVQDASLSITFIGWEE